MEQVCAHGSRENVVNASPVGHALTRALTSHIRDTRERLAENRIHRRWDLTQPLDTVACHQRSFR